MLSWSSYGLSLSGLSTGNCLWSSFFTLSKTILVADPPLLSFNSAVAVVLVWRLVGDEYNTSLCKIGIKLSTLIFLIYFITILYLWRTHVSEFSKKHFNAGFRPKKIASLRHFASIPLQFSRSLPVTLIFTLLLFPLQLPFSTTLHTILFLMCFAAGFAFSFFSFIFLLQKSVTWLSVSFSINTHRQSLNQSFLVNASVIITIYCLVTIFFLHVKYTL